MIHDLTRPGGVMYHEVPGGSCSDHGFVAYQPKFFHRLMQQNDYQKLMFKVWHRRQFRCRPISRNTIGLTGTQCRKPLSKLHYVSAFRKRGNFPFSCPIDAAPAIHSGAAPSAVTKIAGSTLYADQTCRVCRLDDLARFYSSTPAPFRRHQRFF